ncbi:MAG TPA: peptidylprolyl isomerase [candidate division Zixibacteria bacterium]|nr:peptidylprolyl isomerase [candidate division Zixibacteria bacterium]
MLRHVIQNRLIVLLVSLLLASAADARVVEQLVTVIDGEPYTLSSVARFAKTRVGRDFPSGDLNQINDHDREVLEQFITEKLLEGEIRTAGIKISDEDIDQYIEEIKKRNHLSDDDLKAALQREGQTLAGYRAAVKAELEKSALINRQVKQRINITNEDVERYYKLNARKYRAEDRVRLRHILLPLSENAPEEEAKAVLARAGELYQRIASGEDFAKLAREHSHGAGADQGGEIGWVRRGTLLKPIEEVAFDRLSVGQVSKPLRTSMGVHLVKLEAREEGAVLPLSTVGPKIKDELYAKALEERFLRWLKTDLRRKHTVDIKIPGVVFKPEDTTEDTMNSLVAARSLRSSRSEERGFLSYLNPFSYIVKEVPFEEDGQGGPLAGKNVVSVLGIPLFTTEAADDVPDVLAAQPPEPKEQEASESGGFFSTIVDRLNPFKR